MILMHKTLYSCNLKLLSRAGKEIIGLCVTDNVRHKKELILKPLRPLVSDRVIKGWQEIIRC